MPIRWRCQTRQVRDEGTPALAITPFWAGLNEQLIDLVDLLSDETLDWRPTPEVWSCRELFLHIAGARHHWLSAVIDDGEAVPDPEGTDATREQVKHHLAGSWERMERFLRDPEKLAASYRPPDDDPVYWGDPADFTGHYIAFHRLVHDVHHRADILHRLDALGIDLPADRRPRPL